MELFDAYNDQGQKLGIDLVRGQRHPLGLYHKVVQIYTLNPKGELLVTLRHPDKIFGLLWEVTAGSVLKGEDELQGAVRELKEETGIDVDPKDLICFDHHIERDCLWYTYLIQLKEEPMVVYQEGETIDHRWISLEIFDQELSQDRFPMPMKKRHRQALESFKSTLSGLGIVI